MKPAQQQHQLQQQQQQNYPAAPEKPARAFDLFFKHQMDSHSGETNFDRQSYAEQCRYFTYTFENVSFKSLKESFYKNIHFFIDKNGKP